MTREQAEKWIADNEKKPSFVDGVYYWDQEVIPLARELPKHLYTKLGNDYETETEAIEDLIQALMKTYPSEVDPKQLATNYKYEFSKQRELYEDGVTIDDVEEGFLAGFEAARKGQHEGH